jgi:hypothetical protein
LTIFSDVSGNAGSTSRKTTWQVSSLALSETRIVSRPSMACAPLTSRFPNTIERVAEDTLDVRSTLCDQR